MLQKEDCWFSVSLSCTLLFVIFQSSKPGCLLVYVEELKEFKAFASPASQASSKPPSADKSLNLYCICSIG